LRLTSIEFIFILLFLSVLLISSSLFHNAFAESPAFDQIFVTDEQLGNKRTDWVQTYGNDSTHLRSDYANILAVDYVSDGKTLNATLWLKSATENASTYSQPFKKIRYGMLFAIASLPPTSGYNGANYDFYIEAVNGKWSEYLYLLSSTGTRALTYSKINYTEPFGGTMVGPGYVKLRFDLGSIDYPKAYGLSFYTSESFKSNEVRDFTNWVDIPPGILHTSAEPKDTAIRQGEEHIIPVEVISPFSNNVTSIKFDNGTNYSSDGISLSTKKIQPLLLKVEVSPQTPAGVYTIPFVASMSVNTTLASPTTAPATAPVERVTRVVDPEFQVDKKFPTIGYITGPANLTIHVLPPLTFNEEFRSFWDVYGDVIGLSTAGLVGALATLFVDYLKDRKSSKRKQKEKEKAETKDKAKL
jgi:hypothetical protein